MAPAPRLSKSTKVGRTAPLRTPDRAQLHASQLTPVSDHFLRTLAERNDWLTYYSPDFLSEEGRSIPYVYLSTDETPGTGNSTSEKVRIFLQGHVHGNEPAGEEALLALLGKFDANSTWAESVLERVNILILPRYNPDGVAYFQRQLATSFDPNRDFAILGRQQTRDLKALYSEFSAHVFVDCHEYTASSLHGTESNLIKSEDCQLSSVKNLNIHEDILEIQNGLFLNSMAAALESRNLRTNPYFTAPQGQELVLTEPDSHSQYSHHSAGLYQTISLLTETRGIRLGDQHFQRRTAAGLIAIEQVVQTAVDNAEEVYRTVEDAREDFISGDRDIVVTDAPREHNVTWEFINANNGSLVTVPAVFLNSTPPEVNITRARPEAYVFTRAWADVAERLRVSGVKVDRLERDFYGNVEALTIETAELASTKFEGVATTTVTTSSSEKNVTIPAGGFWVSTRQLNAAFAMVFLEPENVASAATYNVVPVEEGDEFPIFRVLE